MGKRSAQSHRQGRGFDLERLHLFYISFRFGGLIPKTDRESKKGLWLLKRDTPVSQDT